MILRGRWVCPIAEPAIENGAVIISNGRITGVGTFQALKGSGGEICDLGDVAILPGLINAHCHLDYTAMAGLLPTTRSFSNWLKSIVALKAEWTEADYERSWLRGAEMLLKSGTTTVVDIEAVPELAGRCAGKTALRVASCHELISFKAERDPATLVESAALEVERWPGEMRGLSPHAPYTTTQELLRIAAEETRRRGWLLTTHVAESEEEFDMFTHGRGPMHEWLRWQRDPGDCGKGTPVEHLQRAGLTGQDVLAVHANYVGRGDIAVLAESGTPVVHCPRSHDYFSHDRFQFDALREAGVNLCLGTDSLATVQQYTREPLELNMFMEMRAFMRVFEGASPGEVLKMATVNAAQAVRRTGELGAVIPGAIADLIAVPAEANSAIGVEDEIVHHRGSVSASMIRGKWAIEPPWQTKSH